ncbi:glycosyltransferase family 4 protein [Chloroflexia bacterium SDU3-3]|nr:glycosyltransferase family 4 protein [Chloroflexia bacterium SDU3-3]
MHIVLNGMFWPEPNTGSGQYLHGLLQTLPQMAPQHRYTVVVPRYRASGPLPQGGAVALVEAPTPLDGVARQLAKLWFEQVAFPRTAARLRADALFVPYAAAPLLAPAPVATTVHDIIWQLLPEYRGKRLFRLYARLVVAATRRAARIFADSEHTRGDIIAHLGIAPTRVSTVLLAAGPQYRPLDVAEARAEVARRYGLEGPFVYYVGGLDARKNVPTLLRAWAALARRGGLGGAALAVAGRALSGDRLLFPDIDGLIAELGLGQSVRRLDVPREDGPLLYSAATAFAFPSRYEGFGLGPLEAMACGAPVVCSSASSLPEVAGDAALLVGPDDVEGWADAIGRLLAEPGLRQQLRERGFARAAQFSYQRAAREIVSQIETLRGTN